MFRNCYKLPESDISNFRGVDDAEKCNVLLDSVGRPVGAQNVDQFDSQPFMQGENGFHRSDIAILMSAQSDDLKRAISQRLEEINTSFPDQSLSDSELCKMAVPRYAQGYSDLRDWMSSLEHSGIAKSVNSFIEANKPKDKVEEKIVFTETKES